MYTFPEELRKAYESMPSAFVYDQYIDGKVVPILVSDGFCELVGLDREKALAWFTEGQFERLHPDDVGRVARVSVKFANKRSGYDLVFRSRHDDGYHVIHAIGKWQIMPDGTELALLTYADLTENFDAMSGTIEDYHLFREDAFYTDSLTGLPNLNYLNQFADERVHALRVKGETPILIYADVISMHYYNSLYGYQKGNELLCQIGEVLKAVFCDALVMRGPDDHFILIDGYESRERTTEKIKTVNRKIREAAGNSTTGIKAGICVYDGQTETSEALDRARNALKWIGNNSDKICNYYSNEAEKRYWNQRYIIDHFEEALEKRYIQPYFQPFFRSVTGQICGAEALARWYDPKKGLLSPADFIPVLESSQLIYRLDMAILRQTCETYIKLRDRGTRVNFFSVNLSRYDFLQQDLFEQVTSILHELNISPRDIKLEITESIMLEDMETFKAVFEKFHGAGFSIWIDDFGSDYSSLNVLQNYDFDIIKFDMLFLRNFSAKSRQVLSSLINMSKSLNIHTLVEGVETEEQSRFLRSVGCEIMQGYLYSRALPLEELIGLLDEKTTLVESAEDRDYWRTIGGLNFLSPNPLEEFSSDNKDCTLCANSTPLALLECSQNQAFYVYVRDAYMKRVLELGYPSIDALEHAFNDRQSDQYLMMKKMILDAVSSDTIQEVEYINNDMFYRVSARCIARKKEHAMLALQLRIFDTENEVKTAREMLQYGNALFATYELVTLIYPDRQASSRIFAADLIPSYGRADTLEESIRRFCEAEIIPDDQERYLQFFDLRTLKERIGVSPRGFIQNVFRMKRKAGGSLWRTIRISRVPSSRETAFIYTIQTLHSGEMQILEVITRQHPELLN